MRRSTPIALAVVVLVVTTGLFVTTAPTFRAPTPGPKAPPAAASLRTFGNTSINDIIDANQSEPLGTFAPGSYLEVSYRVTTVTTPATSSVTVYVPGLVASFPAVPAPVNLFLPPHNLTMASGANSTSAPTAFTLRNSTTFNASHAANLNSELVALMSSVPFGSSSVTVEWNWSLRTVDGAVTTSGWGPANGTPIHPAEVAFLESLTPRTLVPPASVTACIQGPIQARTFSLHAETAKPFDDFVANTTRDLINGPSTLCLSVVIPPTISPQTILMHIWDYESVTLLLYVVKVKVVNESVATGPGLATPGWTTLADAGLGAGAVVVGLAVVVAVRREPPFPPPGAGGGGPVPSGSGAGTGTPSTPPPASPPPREAAGAGAGRSTG